MYNEHKKESMIKLLFMMIKKQIENNKSKKLIELKMKGEKPKVNKIEYKLSEYKLNNLRQNMYDLEQLKFATSAALNLQVLRSIDEKIDKLHKEENQLIKYRLQA